MVGAMMKE